MRFKVFLKISSIVILLLLITKTAIQSTLAVTLTDDWSQTISAPENIASNYVTTYNDRIYSFAGATSSVFQSGFFSSTLNINGTVNSWSDLSSKPPARYWHSGARFENYVYLLGGIHNSNITNTVIMGEINKNTGDINNWTSQPNLPQALTFGSATVSGNYIYYAGGNTSSGENASSSTNQNIYMAEINPIDGSLSSWTTGSIAGTLPEKLIGFTMFEMNGYLYVVGGKNPIGVTSSVKRALINNNGTISPDWQQMSPLPLASYRSGVSKSNNFVVVAGGRVQGENIINNVFYAEPDSNGIISEWQTGHPLGEPSCCTTLANHNNFLYFVGGHNGSIYSKSVILTNLTPEPALVSLDIAPLKQFDHPWGNQNYGYTDKTIGELGCALTSASMVLKYFGHNLNPDELNNWLKSQPDGFIRNSMVNWLAISRYTLIHDSPSSPTLEYTRETATDENILSNLTESVLDFPGIPSIIKTPGHFVVTKSKTTSSFGINDPGYNINELSAYNNLLSLGKYYPSHTNLSYFMFITNPSLTLKIFDELGEEISTQQSFIETPLQILNNTNSFGEELKITILPKPILGNYTLKISGSSGKYLFDAYLYDTSGSVQLDNFVGYLSGYDTDSYNISFTNHKKIDPSKTSIVNDLLYGLMNNKFKNFGVFNAIYTQFTKKASLTNLTKQIQSLTPKLIDQEFSSILQVNLTSLVGQ